MADAMRFRKNIKALMVLQDNNGNEQLSCSSEHLSPASKKAVKATALSTSSVVMSSRVVSVSPPASTSNSSFSISGPSTFSDETESSGENSPRNSHHHQRQADTSTLPSTPGEVEIQSRTPQTSPPRKRQREPAATSGGANRVAEILKGTAYGRGILNLRLSSKSLGEADQNRLAELVVDSLLTKDNNYKLKTEDFDKTLKEILELFPYEKSATYYIPYRKEGHVKCLAKGKLVTKYHSLRKFLRSAGEIQCDDVSDKNVNGEEEVLGTEGLEEKLQFLKTTLDDWNSIYDVWKETSKYRLRCLQTTPHLLTKNKKPKKGQEDAQNSVAAYLDLFPILKDFRGYQLLCSDFDIAYPEYQRAIYSEWDGFVKKALAALKNIEKPCDALKDNLLLIEDDNFEKDVNDLIVLLSLGYLDTVVTVTRIKKDNKFLAWRPPYPEIQEGLISVVETTGKLETFILQRFEKFEKWKQSVQPFCVAVGLNISEVEQFWVVVDKKTKYEFSSAQRALEVCFKILHACHARYSSEAYRLWMLIQLKLFKLKTSFDDLKSDAQLSKILDKF